MDTSSVNTSIRPDGVAVLTIDQPDSKANILTRQLWADLEMAVDRLAPRVDVSGLVIVSAKPGIFIAGADLKLLANAPGPNDPEVRSFIEDGLRVLEKLEAVPFPTCAVIDGAALGGGLEVALACDMRVLTNQPKTRLGLPEVTLGLIPGWGGTQRLPRIVEEEHLEGCLDFLASGSSVGAEEADELGLVDAWHVDSSQLMELARFDRYARQRERLRERRRKKLEPLYLGDVEIPEVSGAAAEALAVLVAGASLSLYDAIRLETEVFMRLAGSPESKRLIVEFFASRRK